MCADDLMKHRSVYGLFDCGAKGVFELFLYSHLVNWTLESLVLTFSCR